DRCGHMQLDPMPAAAVLADAYAAAASEDYVEEERGRRERSRRARERIKRYAAPAGGPPAAAPRLLDLGCWVGFLMAEARERGWDPLGVEPSEFAAAYARERLGLSVINDGLFEAELPAHAFTAV